MTRLHKVGMGATVLLVLLLAGSLVAGLRGDGGGTGDEPPRAPGRSGERVRVEVLNAAGISGLARAATELLRDRGYDVVYYGNAPGSSRDTSVVLDRTGKAAVAREVAEAAGIERVRTEGDTTRYVDVSVVLGRDWARTADATGPAPDDSAAALR